MKAFPQTGNYTQEFGGMELRDYFAAHVIQGMFSNPVFLEKFQDFKIIEAAFAVADDMMKAREQNG